MSRIISTQMTARRALAPMTMNRRPPRARSSAGPMSGATTAKGAMVSARYSVTLPRAALGSMSKNSELASASAMRVSPATAAAWVRARRVKGVTTKERHPPFGAASTGAPTRCRGIGPRVQAAPPWRRPRAPAGATSPGEAVAGEAPQVRGVSYL